SGGDDVLFGSHACRIAKRCSGSATRPAPDAWSLVLFFTRVVADPASIGGRDPWSCPRYFVGTSLSAYASSLHSLFPGGDQPLEDERIRGELQIHAVVVRPDGRDPGDDDAQIVGVEGVDDRLAEVHHRADRGDALEAGPFRDRRQIGHTRRG